LAEHREEDWRKIEQNKTLRNFNENVQDLELHPNAAVKLKRKEVAETPVKKRE